MPCYHRARPSSHLLASHQWFVLQSHWTSPQRLCVDDPHNVFQMDWHTRIISACARMSTGRQGMLTFRIHLFIIGIRMAYTHIVFLCTWLTSDDDARAILVHVLDSDITEIQFYWHGCIVAACAFLGAGSPGELYKLSIYLMLLWFSICDASFDFAAAFLLRGFNSGCLLCSEASIWLNIHFAP